MGYYVDTSAVLKLIRPEAESRALHEWVASEHPMLISSDLMYTELIRSGRRVGVTALDLDEALEAIDYVPMTTEIFVAAGDLEPLALKSLDALHLATALHVSDSCRALVTYDKRLAEAATAAGLDVFAPA